MAVRFVMVLTLVMATFSGCIAGVGTMTAFDGINTATNHVQDLLDTDLEPTLIGITSVEPFSLLEDESDNVTVNVYADSVQGDGRVPGWIYEFCIDDAYVAVVMASGIGVLADVRDGGDCDADDEARLALTNYEIDSDEAAEILAANETWPEAQSDSGTFWMLAQEPPDNDEFEPGAYWIVETGNMTTWGEAAINAQTGEIAYVESGEYREWVDEGVIASTSDESCFGWSSSGGYSSGLLTPVSSRAATFSVVGVGTASYELTTSNQLTTVVFEFLDEDGEVLYEEVIDDGLLGGDTISGTFEDLEPGDYMFRVQTDTHANYRFSYDSYSEYTC